MLRTGDTPSDERAQQDSRLPAAPVATPESLAWMLTRADAREWLQGVQNAVVDEWQELLGGKRGVQVPLALARMRRWCPRQAVRGLLATLANLDKALAALLLPGEAGSVVHGRLDEHLRIDKLLPPEQGQFFWASHRLKQLEEVLGAHTVIATNTSSVSVTEVANSSEQPQRLVDEMSGLQTAPAVADEIFGLSRPWGKVPLHAKSTRCFIVNRVARPHNAEVLALLHEQMSLPQAFDACLRTPGFRMGPCERMSLIGYDTNFVIANSIYKANCCDKRLVTSLVQRELVERCLLGRKSGQRFCPYPAGAPTLAPVSAAGSQTLPQTVVVHERDPLPDCLHVTVKRGLIHEVEHEDASAWTGRAIDGALWRPLTVEPLANVRPERAAPTSQFSTASIKGKRKTGPWPMHLLSRRPMCGRSRSPPGSRPCSRASTTRRSPSSRWRSGAPLAW